MFAFFHCPSPRWARLRPEWRNATGRCGLTRKGGTPRGWRPAPTRRDPPPSLERLLSFLLCFAFRGSGSLRGILGSEPGRVLLPLSRRGPQA
eukprot:7952384-Pyramimonas_sp.AAC.1